MDSAALPRSYLRVAGPDAAGYLQRMLSNEVEGLAAGESRPALLLTPKGRVIAPLLVLRRDDDDFLLLTEPGLGEVVGAHLGRMRLRARCEIEPEEHASTLVFGGTEGLPLPGYGGAARELLDAGLEPTLAAEELELRRIESGTPAWGKEIDERVLPAEAGLDETHVSFAKGCYPGQEPVARLRYRGHPNRRLRALALEATEAPAGGEEVFHDGRAVGRVTSAVRAGERVVALAYVRTEVPADAELTVGGAAARPLHFAAGRP